MSTGVVKVQVRGVVPTATGCAVFLGNDEKVFVIYVDQHVGSAIARIAQGQQYSRPLTHDLIGQVFAGLGVTVQRVVINDLHDNTFFARLLLHQESELGRKIVEVDARPSDSIALALQARAEILVAEEVFATVEDMSWVLKSQSEGGSPEE